MKHKNNFFRKLIVTAVILLPLSSFFVRETEAQIIPQELLQRVGELETRCRALESAYELDQLKQTAGDAKALADEATALLSIDLNNAVKQKLYYCRGLANAFPAYNHRFEHNRMADNIFHVKWQNRYDLVYTAGEIAALRTAAADLRRAVTTAGEFLPKPLPVKVSDSSDGAQKMIRLVAVNRLTSASALAFAQLEIATRGTQTETDFQLAADTAAEALSYSPPFDNSPAAKVELYKTRGCALVSAGKSFAAVTAEFDAAFDLRPEAAYVIFSQARRCFMQASDVWQANAYTLHLARLMKARSLATKSIAENTKAETEFSRLQSPAMLPLSQLRFGVLEMSGNKPTAEGYLETAHKLSPNRALPLVALAQTKYQQKKPDEAIRYATAALIVETANVGALAVRGFAYAAKNDAAAAEKDLSAAIKENSELAFAYGVFVTRARIYQAIGKTDLAAADLARHQELLSAFE